MKVSQHLQDAYFVARRSGLKRAKHTVTGVNVSGGRGFVQLSVQLLRHPGLSASAKLVLQLLIADASSFAALNEGREVSTRATRKSLMRDSGLSSSTVDKALGRLGDVGLVKVVQGSGRRSGGYYLRPGPWPRLGDADARDALWSDDLHGGERYQSFELLLSEGVDPEQALCISMEVPLNTLKTRQAVRRSHDLCHENQDTTGGDSASVVSYFLGHYDEFVSKKIGHYDKSDDAEKTPESASDTGQTENRPQGTRNSPQSLQEITLQEPPSQNRSGRVKQPAREKQTRAYPEGVSIPENSGEVKERAERGNASARAASVHAGVKQSRRDPKPPSDKHLFRDAFTARSQALGVTVRFERREQGMRNALFKRYESDSAALAAWPDWAFDNFEALKASERGGILENALSVPLNFLCAVFYVDKYLPYVKQGKSLSARFDWAKLSAQSSRDAEIDEAAQAEVEALLGAL